MRKFLGVRQPGYPSIYIYIQYIYTVFIYIYIYRYWVAKWTRRFFSLRESFASQALWREGSSAPGSLAIQDIDKCCILYTKLHYPNRFPARQSLMHFALRIRQLSVKAASVKTQASHALLKLLQDGNIRHYTAAEWVSRAPTFCIRQSCPGSRSCRSLRRSYASSTVKSFIHGGRPHSEHMNRVSSGPSAGCAVLTEILYQV